MKKILLAILILLLITFLIPLLFTKTITKQVVAEEKKEEPKEQVIPVSKIIRLLHTKTNEVEEVNLEEYLYHVVSAEMPVTYEIEALKAQAIVARTYTLYKMQEAQKKHENADICDSASCCQAWISKEDRLAKWEENVREENWKKIVTSVNDTMGKIITYAGKPINAFFHASSGGMTEIPFNVWGGSGYPYLQAVATAGEEEYSQYRSEIELTKEELASKIKQKHPEFAIAYEDSDAISITERTEGNRVKTIKIGNVNLSGVETRTLLGLRSANFTFFIKENSILFEVIGYGHGVGMSQTGADALAKQGKNAEEIINHFYKDVEIKQQQ